LNLIEQPHIRDSNYGLIGEAGNEFYLLVTKRLDLRARQKDDTDHVLMAQQGYPQHRARFGMPLPTQIGKAAVGKRVRQMHRLLFGRDDTDGRAIPRHHWIILHPVSGWRHLSD